MKNLAIIPARSGSKGLPDKNIRLLEGKPMMAYSIEAAQNSGEFEEIMVSTDSEKYADIARRCGASVPFLRSTNLSNDQAGSWDVVKEVLKNYHDIGREFDTVCLLQPTSPLRTEEDIIEAYSIYYDRASVAVVSVCEVEHSPLLSNTLSQDHSLDGFIQTGNDKRRQAGDIYYRLNGAIYIVNVRELYNDIFLYRSGSYAYIMPQDRSIDIDTLFDFELAEFLLGRR